MSARLVKVGIYRARFFFDWGYGHCLWAANDRTRSEFSYEIDHHRLGLPTEVAAELDRLEAWQYTSLNWDSPADPGPWREAECQAFNGAVLRVVAILRETLGPEWDVVNEEIELHEDPDLDRYLLDPANFRR